MAATTWGRVTSLAFQPTRDEPDLDGERLPERVEARDDLGAIERAALAIDAMGGDFEDGAVAGGLHVPAHFSVRRHTGLLERENFLHGDNFTFHAGDF